MVDIDYLKAPLYGLYHVDNISEYQGLSFDQWDRAKVEYTGEQLESIVGALRWAIKNKDYDFNSLLPDLPFNNEQIYEFICKMEFSLKEYEAHKSIKP